MTVGYCSPILIGHEAGHGQWQSCLHPSAGCDNCQPTTSCRHCLCSQFHLQFTGTHNDEIMTVMCHCGSKGTTKRAETPHKTCGHIAVFSMPLHHCHRKYIVGRFQFCRCQILRSCQQLARFHCNNPYFCRWRGLGKRHQAPPQLRQVYTLMHFLQRGIYGNLTEELTIPGHKPPFLKNHLNCEFLQIVHNNQVCLITGGNTSPPTQFVVTCCIYGSHLHCPYRVKAGSNSTAQDIVHPSFRQ